jgi:hypothetical protein
MSRLHDLFERLLDPGEWWGTVLFGLIMVLIFTLGARSIVAQGEDATRDMLVAVIGCNVAWGVIQGWMYILDEMFERGRLHRLVKEVQEGPDEQLVIEAIRDELDPMLGKVTSDEERGRLYAHILGNIKKAKLPKTRVTRADIGGALAVFVLVSLTTVPAVVPFLCIDNLRTALRVSNLLLLLLLFFVGFKWAGITNTNRWIAGLLVMLIGVAMVGIAEVLGG